MRNRRKKHQRKIPDWIKLTLIISGSGGLYVTNSLKGAAIVLVTIMIIIFLSLLWRSKHFEKGMKDSGIEKVDQMPGRQFEEYIEFLFKRQGYSVELTLASCDYGADLILIKGKHRIVVQAKRYKSTVGLTAVQEVFTSMNMYDATDAWVITNSTYTKPALILAEVNKVKMIDREMLIQMILEKKNVSGWWG